MKPVMILGQPGSGTSTLAQKDIEIMQSIPEVEAYVEAVRARAA